MRQRWVDDDSCWLEQVQVTVARSDFGDRRTSETGAWVAKERLAFEFYASLFESPPKAVVEFGIYEGGSAMLFADLWTEAVVVGIDIRKENNWVKKHLDQLGFGNRVKLHYETSQADERVVTSILKEEFNDGIDLVIDDASHTYADSKITFEVAFPLVKAGGFYAIEDWGWAHWPGWQESNYYSGKPALSNLIFEIAMTMASKPELIADMTLTPTGCLVRKGPAGVSDAVWKLDDLYLARGRTLSLI